MSDITEATTRKEEFLSELKDLQQAEARRNNLYGYGYLNEEPIKENATTFYQRSDPIRQAEELGLEVTMEDYA